MKITFTHLTAANKPDAILIFPVGEDKKLSKLADALDKQAGGALSKALHSGKLAGQRGQFVCITPPANVKAYRILLAGIGDGKKLDLTALENIGGSVVPYLNKAGAESAVFMLEGIKGMKASLPEA